MEIGQLALEYFKVLLSSPPLVAGIILFLLWKYREPIGGIVHLLGSQAEFRRKLDTAVQINFLGHQFTRVAALYDKLLGDKMITPDQYRGWRTFAMDFKTAYPQMIDFWKDATETSGRAVHEQARAKTLALTKAMAEFEATAYRHLAKTLTGP